MRKNNILKLTKIVAKPREDYHEDLFENQITDNERLLTKKELADFLNVSVKMIDRKVHMNEIPFLKIGRLVRFSKRSILVWANRAS